MENTMNKEINIPTAYVITHGEYSDYSIHSVWTDKEEAEKTLALLNVQHAIYDNPEDYEEYRIEEFNLNSRNNYESEGFKATYDCAKYGYTVNVDNIVISEAIIPNNRWREGKFTWKEVVLVEAETVEAAQKIIFDIVAEEAAKKTGLTE